MNSNDTFILEPGLNTSLHDIRCWSSLNQKMKDATLSLDAQNTS